MPIESLGEFRGRERVTPTGLAEEVYLANKLKQNRPMPIGPSGLAIPDPRAIFRVSMDGKLLGSLVRAAGAAYRRDGITAAERAGVVASLVEDIRRRHPPSDMAVLDRYGFARVHEKARIEILSIEFVKDIFLQLPAGVIAPPQGANFHSPMGGKGRSTFPPVPPAGQAYVRKIIELQIAERRLFGGISSHIDRFKVAKGRAPRWIEIEREFAAFGAWLQRERAQIKDTTHAG